MLSGREFDPVGWALWPGPRPLTRATMTAYEATFLGQREALRFDLSALVAALAAALRRRP